jgi:hypothetical protein
LPSGHWRKALTPRERSSRFDYDAFDFAVAKNSFHLKNFGITANFCIMLASIHMQRQMAQVTSEPGDFADI